MNKSSPSSVPASATEQSKSAAHKASEKRGGGRETASAGEARGHDDQGGSRQSEQSDYERRGLERGGSEGGPVTHGEHNKEERFGEQSAAQRRESEQQVKEGNFGGQNSRDQGYVKRPEPEGSKPGAHEK